MAKSQGLGGSRRSGRGKSAAAAEPGVHIAPGRVNDTGSRAMPGKVSRGALQRVPGERLSSEITVDAPGVWAFHCHILYHMEAGMFRAVSVAPKVTSEVSK